MLQLLVLIASGAFTSWSTLPSVHNLRQPERVLQSSEHLQTIYPHNVVCKDFERMGLKVWHLRNRSAVDLGNWDGAFWVSGAISRGIFVRKGFDLLDVLESKCGMSAQDIGAKHMQG